MGSPSCVSVLSERTERVRYGISVSRLRNGSIAVSAREGNRRPVINEIPLLEFKKFLAALDAFVSRFPDDAETSRTADVRSSVVQT